MTDTAIQEPTEINDQLILVVGESTMGKSFSLKNIRNQPRWMYLGTEAGKRLPFRNDFDRYTITEPYQVHEAFNYAIGDGKDSVDGIILDSLTFLMDMFESQYVFGAADGRAAWGAYQQFFKQLMNLVAIFGKPVVIIAHTRADEDKATGQMGRAVPIKGALRSNGVEAYFTTVVAAKRVTLKELEKYSSGLLTITEDDQELGFKHVFQTRLTKGTTGDRIRAPFGMFSREETYVDNDVQALLDRLNEFYK